MTTDDVILGALTPCHDHTHLEWVCPGCGCLWSVGGHVRQYRYLCDGTGREFLVIGIPPDTKERRGAHFRPDASLSALARALEESK
jgi:hypothetical protein